MFSQEKPILRFHNRVIFFFLLNIIIIIFMSGCYYINCAEDLRISFPQEELSLVRQMENENGESYESREAGFYMDESYAGKERRIESPEFTLGRGIYRVTVQYGTLLGDAYSDVSCSDGGDWRRLRSTGVGLPAEDGTESYLIYSSANEMKVTVRSHLSSESQDYILIDSIQVQAEDLNPGYWFAATVFLILLADLLAALVLRWGRRISPRLWLGLLILAFLSCYPLLMEYLIAGDDIYFHLMRIEGLKDGLKSGSFPVKIQPTWSGGSGYAVGTMYGDTLLYLPALLRLIDIPVQTAYKLYVAFANLLTVAVSFFSFTKMTGDKRLGFLGCTMYTLTMYRLTDVYTRAAVGEYTAMAFYPLVAYGVYLIYKEESSRAIPVLVTGFSGILQSHILSCEMVAFFVLIVSLVLWKKTLKKTVLLIYLKAAGWMLLMNAWFLVPFLDYFFTMPFGVRNNVYNDFRIQRKGLALTKLFSISVHTPVGIGAYGIEGETGYRLACTIGLSFMVVLLLFFWQEAGTLKCLKNRGAGICVCLTALALFMSTAYFPYDYLSERIPTLRSIFGSLQFPWRFLAIAGLLLSWMACLTVERVEGEERKRKLLYGLCLLAGLQGLYSGEAMLTAAPNRIQLYDAAAMDTYQVLYNEYVPAETNLNHLLTAPVGSEGVVITGYEKEYNRILIQVENTQPEGYVEVPLIYYKGYRAVDGEGNRWPVSMGTNCQARIGLPTGSVSLEVRFVEPWLWRLAEITSAFALAGAFGMWYGRRIKGKRTETGSQSIYSSGELQRK